MKNVLFEQRDKTMKETAFCGKQNRLCYMSWKCSKFPFLLKYV